MDLEHTVEHRSAYSVVRVRGDVAVGQFLSFLEVIGIDSQAWPTRRLMFDLRGVRSLVGAGEHRSVGAQVVRHLSHLERVASVVPPDRMTGESERVARASGVNLRVFTTEAEAIAWLVAP